MSDAGPELEIGHVLFIDIVGYSKLVIDEQREAQRQLNEAVRNTEQFKLSDSGGKLVRLPTGDGIALVFRDSVEAPTRCASQLARGLSAEGDIQLRMGIHSGPVSDVTDVNERANVAGDGVNVAQRVMDCGDAGHILLSKRVADDLSHYARWRPQVHHLGDIEVKHGRKIDIFNLVGDGIGNPVVPQKIATRQREQQNAAEREQKRLRRKRRIVGVTIIAAAFAAIAASFIAYRMSRRLSDVEAARKAAMAIPEKSVAVLPFENLSADPSNAFFVNGVQDEILTRVAKVAALKVISRTSTRRYEAKPANLRQIAQELGVANILEGSVQRIADKVRVNVQLIKAANDTHLWAETYDRELTDMFAVESEVASRIATSLKATLSPEEKQRVNAIPTTNPDAYEAYLQGREMLVAPSSYLPEYDAKQREFYEHAITLDPEFALAHAALSQWYSLNALQEGVTTEKRIKARSEADEALRLQPDLGEARKALGYYYYGVEHNYDAAEKEYAVALRALPNDAELLRIMALMNRRRGHWRAAIEGLQRSVSVDPRNVQAINWLGQVYTSVHDYAAAEETRRREVEVASAISPESAVWAKARLYMLQWARGGSIAPLRPLLDQLPNDFSPALRGQIIEDIAYVQRDPDMMLKGVAIAQDEQDLAQFFMVVQPLLAKGDTKRAREVIDPFMASAEDLVKKNPTEAQYHSKLGLWYAYAGRKEDAIREGRRGVELLPETKDAAEGPILETWLAIIYAKVGEPDRALDLIEHLLTIPCDEDALHKSDLQVSWSWDPLRQNPRFQKILASPDPKVIYN